ncbi:nucleotide sugar dehydrogenase [Streptomyces sp. TP-A0874]|uniref:nucleotide sugar dehydrogenase n=1 Tax=Streptomyces sp. TP-A0874 TaxID=549819 RepID=UPI000852C1FB|nr:nucleotide sugar dehydrogenase [Streptomyces sp. TP-A0874]
MRSKAVILGQGYVGLPLAVRAAHAGHRVVGLDTDTDRVKRLMVAESYVEDVPGEQLARLLDDGSYLPTSDPKDLEGFDTAVITVPTPLREGVPDLTYIEHAARTVAARLRPGATVILESTTYPGTTVELLSPILESGSGLTAGADFHLGYSPERIDPGNRQWHLGNTPKVVSGIDEASLAAVRRFYESFVDTVVPVGTPAAAELSKLVENTFRHVNIALVNEIAVYAHELGVDVWETLDAAGSKPFGFMRFTPGPGVGGHCLPIDPEYLSWRVHRTLGRRFRFVELANEINGHMPDYVVQRLLTAFNTRRRSLAGSRVLLLGVAYKANTSDTRESPALRTHELLRGMGAEVRVVDPHVAELPPSADGVTRAEFCAEELAAADAVVLLTDHDAFDYDLIRRQSRYVLDCRRRLAPGGNIEVL